MIRYADVFIDVVKRQVSFDKSELCDDLKRHKYVLLKCRDMTKALCYLIEKVW